MNQQASIIIVSYESGETLDFCLSSLIDALQTIEYQIIIWDNHSQNTDHSYFQARYPEIQWILNGENIGFGKACNQASKLAIYSNLIFLNPDTISSRLSFGPLLSEIESSDDIGVVGGKVLNSDGSLQMACRRSFPTPVNALYRLLGLSKFFPNSKTFAEYDLRYLPENERSEVDAVSGSFFGIKKSLFEDIGGFDERFFMYGEDLDLCRRVQLLGKKNIYQPKAEMIHLKGKSASSRPWKSFYNFYEAMIVFSKIHYGKVMLAHIILSFGVLSSALLAVGLRGLSKWRVIPVDVVLLSLTAFTLKSLIAPGFSIGVNTLTLLACIAVFINLCVGKYGHKDVWRIWEFLIYTGSGFFIVFYYLGGDFGHQDSLFYTILFPLFYGVRSCLLWVKNKGLTFLKKRRKIVFVGDGNYLDPIHKARSELEHLDCLGYIQSPNNLNIGSKDDFLGHWSDLERLYRSLGPFELWIISEKTAWWREFSPNSSHILEKMPIFLVYETSQSRLFNVVNLHLK